MENPSPPPPACDPTALIAAADRCTAAGERQRALALFDRAIALAPDCAPAWAGAGLALQALGRPGEAMAALCRARCLNPGHAPARNGIGTLLLARGLPGEAAAEFAAAAEAAPGWWVPWVNGGLAAQHRGRPEAALAPLHRAVELAPAEAEPWHALGTALILLHRPEEAEAALRRALALAPDHALAHGNLGRALRDQNRVAEARGEYAAALALRPDHAEARWNLAIADLLLGDWDTGWEGAEVRWAVPSFPSRPRSFAQPLWQGEALEGRTLLLHAEQGFGDSIMMLRYLPLVAARGGRLLLELPAELLPLAAGLPAEPIAAGSPLPNFDLHCPLLSLPHAFGTRPETVPPAPYLRPPEEAAARWAGRLPADGGPPRVGLVWAGRPTHRNDANRSIGLAALAPLLAMPGLRFYGLQAGPRAAEIGALGLAPQIEDLSPLLADFGETAAALARLDLLVAVDTAVLHLAGALGRPFRALLPFAPDWRWMLGREDTPWYPTGRLLRQARPGDWSAPLAALAADLADLAPFPALAAE
ncbi:tetratricopeptide repeat protein [Belnapia sp. T6]|uniref:Tetratricopeptide repeat protein n=1 Tax=Belnapia mucosa TaxID=2804532 RepID=A0ABS1V1H0_9PROT|nr:tetratricopeptide repeat protein [Belnapia mucosa]MBL6455553.1 tetratricopeptide repeat protein [Belnapia mucosa]